MSLVAWWNWWLGDCLDQGAGWRLASASTVEIRLTLRGGEDD